MSRPPPPLPFPIPNSILLYIHLHLLRYPLEDAECDADLFNSTIRGIGDRIKSMEHIVYFLIGSAEGQQQARTLLPMYPCKQPSDTVSFRTAVIKYLEATRAAALKPQKTKTAQPVKSYRNSRLDSASSSNPKRNVPLKPSIPFSQPGSSVRSVSGTSTVRSASVASSNSSRAVSSANSAAQRSKHRSSKDEAPLKSDLPEPYGWWWKDVLVRKSLLEECTGDRFERLILALSVHALFITRRELSRHDQKVAELLDGLDVSSNLALFNTLSEQPDEYQEAKQRTNLLQTHSAQEKEALFRRRVEVTNMKEKLFVSVNSQPIQKQSIEELATTKGNLTTYVTNLLESLGDGAPLEQKSLSQGLIKKDEVLSFLFETAGLLRPLHENDPSNNQNEGKPQNDKLSEGLKARGPARRTILPAPPLPTAAALHFASLNLLTKLNEFCIIAPSSLADVPQKASMSQQGPLSSGTSFLQHLNASEANLTDALKGFKKELRIMHANTQEELQRRQAELNEATEREDSLHNETEGETEELQNGEVTNLDQKLDLPTHSDDLRLNFEFPKTAPSLPPCLQRDLPLNFIDASNTIRDAILSDIPTQGDNSLVEEDLEYEDSNDEDEEVDIEDEEPDEAISQPILTSQAGDQAQASSSRIPTYLPTPKRTMAIEATPKASRIRPITSPEQTPRQYGRNNNLGKTPSKVQSRYQASSSTSMPKTPPRSYEVGATPSMSIFITPSKNQENLKDILPPFQSPWRSVNRAQKFPRKSIKTPGGGRPRISGWMTAHKPRPSRDALASSSSSSFIRTPLKSGKRLSSIIPPVNFILASGRRDGTGQGTPRASLDDVYEEIIDDLVKDVTLRTPPSVGGSRLLDFGNNIQRSSPFKSLMASGRGPRTPQSPDIISNTGLDEPSFGTVGGLDLRHPTGEEEWEDVMNDPDGTSTLRRRNARMSLGTSTRTSNAGLTAPRLSEEYYEGPSFTLHDMLLKAGRDGIQGANGTFNFNLLHNNELEEEGEGEDESLYL